MPIKTVTTPDGDTYTITAPEGASDEQIFTTFQRFLTTLAGQALAQKKAAGRRRPDTAPEPVSPTPLMSTGQVSPLASPPTSRDIAGGDWLSALARLQQGRVSDPSQDTLSAGDPLAMWPGRGQVARTTARDAVEALPFGDLADPVSQLAFLLAPHLTKLLGSRAAPTVGARGTQSGTGSPPPGPSQGMSDDAVQALKQQFGVGEGTRTAPVPAAPPPTGPAPRQLSLDAPAPMTPPPAQPASPVPSPPVATSPPPTGLASIAPSALKTDPERFQYKLTHTKTGSTGTLTDASHYDPNLAGVVQVWRDPADGATYVVNGHNRVELAQRAHAPSINIQYLDAPDAQTARGIGALTNIAQGNGTPLDAAKFFRDTGLGVADLRAKGIAMKGSLAQDGLALANLNPALFGAVTRGDVSVPRGIIIGQKVPDATQQFGLMRLLDKAQASGKRVTDDTVAELADMVTTAPTHTATEQTLFGAETTTTSLALEKAELLSHLRSRLVDEKNLFGKVGQHGTAEKLSEAGNVIDVAQSQARGQQAGQVLALFDRLKNVTGPISDAVNAAAVQIAGGARASIVRERLYRQLLADFPALVRGAEGTHRLPGAGVSGAGAGETLPGF